MKKEATPTQTDRKTGTHRKSESISDHDKVPLKPRRETVLEKDDGQ